MNIHQMMSALLLVLQSCALALPSGIRSPDSDKPRQPRSSSKSAQRSEHSSSLLSSTLLPSALLAESAKPGLVEIKKTPIPQFKKKKRQSKRNGLKPRRKYHMSRKIEQKNPVTTHNDVSGSAPVSSRRQSDLHTTSGNAPRRSKNRRTSTKRRRNRKRCRKNRKNRKKNKKKRRKNKKRHTRRPKGCKGNKSKRKNSKKIKKIRSRRHKTHKGGKTTTVCEVPNLSAKEAKMLPSAVPLRSPVKPSASTRMLTARELSEGYKYSAPLPRNHPASHKLEKEKEMRDLEFLQQQETKPLQTQQPSREKLSPENHDSSKDSVDVSRSRYSIDDTTKLGQGYASSVLLQRRKRSTGFSSLSQKLLRIGSSDNKETVPFIFQMQTALKSEQSELSWLVRRHFSSSRSDGLLDKLLT